METAVIVSALRTPIGRYLGALKSVPAPALAGAVLKQAVARAGVAPGALDEVILGLVVSAGVGQAPARQAAALAGIPEEVPAVCVNKVCGSGLKAVMLAAQAIACGDSRVAAAGGMESMSLAPHLLPGARRGLSMAEGRVLDALITDGLQEAGEGSMMGMTAETVAEKFSISRQTQDAFALESYRRARAAQAAGAFKEEIVPLEALAEDEEPKAAPLEKMPGLKPVFKAGGTVTAANASKLSDGAAALVLMSAGQAGHLGLKPLARVLGWAQASTQPRWVMLAPLAALAKLKEKTGLEARQMDLVEINEAFSAATIALIQELGLDPTKVNVNGGAVALGHPLGASGARILVTLIHALRQRGLKRGIATLCMGGGEGLALAVEAI